VKLLYSFLFLFSSFSSAKAQEDTIIISKNYKFKIGAKFIVESSGDNSFSDRTASVGSFGAQVIYKLGRSKSSIESGFYYLNRAAIYEYDYYPPGSHFYADQYFKITYGNLHLPLNYRLDTRIIYFRVGTYFDYLVRTSTDYEFLLDSLKYYGNYGTDRKFNMGLDMGIGFEKQFSKTLSLFAEAELSMNLTSPKMENGFWIFDDRSGGGFANVGCAFGINYKLLRKN